MKNLILFTTKYGSVAKCANMLQERLEGDTTVVNLKTETVPELQQFDTILLGGSIYVGKIQHELTEFMTSNLELLLQKRIALFVCAGEQGDKRYEQFKHVFPEPLYRHAITKEILGDEVTIENVNFLEKLALRFFKHITSSYSHLSEENIAKLAAAVNQQ